MISRHFSRWMSVMLMMSVGTTAASAATQTYDFTGSISSSNLVGWTAGTPLTGMFTIDYDAAAPGQGYGTFNSATGTWGVASNVPAPATGPVPSLVFTESLNFGGLILTTYDSYANTINSSVQGGAGEFLGNVQLNHVTETSMFGEDFNASNGVTYLSNGMPDFSAVPAGDITGDWYQNLPNEDQYGKVNFVVTSVSPVPLPGAVWLLLSGLGAVGAAGRRLRGYAC